MKLIYFSEFKSRFYMAITNRDRMDGNSLKPERHFKTVNYTVPQELAPTWFSVLIDP